MSDELEEAFNALGESVGICPMPKLIKKEVIEIGDFSMIDDFTFIYEGKGVKIGRYVHIASFVSVIGGGELEIGDYAVVACGARLITGTDRYIGGARMSAALPLEQRNVKVDKIVNLSRATSFESASII